VRNGERVPETKRRYVRKKVTVSALAAVQEEHGKRLVDLERLPVRMKRLLHDFERLREDVTEPLGVLGLHQRAATRVQLAIAEKLGVEVAAADLDRLHKPLPGEPSFPVKL
jgi:hypothetical protein